MNSIESINPQYEYTLEELDDLLMLVKKLYDYDFTNYAKSSLRRRINRILHHRKCTLFELKLELTNKPNYLPEFVVEITVNVTEMFRDPLFYKAVREKVLPYLASFPRLKLWNAGCSSGEELYSFAILLQEEGLYKKSFLYGTDINSDVLSLAREGIYELKEMKTYAQNFLKTSPKHSLSDYYTAAYNRAAINQSLKKNVLFSTHNLANDGVFNEFQIIVCRNVLIYFDLTLQEKVLHLLYESLCPLGFLCLGSKETIRFSSLKSRLKPIDQQLNIYQKIG